MHDDNVRCDVDVVDPVDVDDEETVGDDDDDDHDDDHDG
jgi:hypothetical protein